MFLTDDDLRRDVADGLSDGAIAARSGAAAENPVGRSCGASARGSRHERIAALLIGGASMSEAAAAMGVSLHCAYSYASRARYLGLMGAEVGRRRDGREREAAALALQGVSVERIAETMGVSRQSVSDWLSKARRLGLLPTDYHAGRVRRLGRIADVARLASEGLDRGAIAARLGLSASQVSDALTDARKRGLAPPRAARPKSAEPPPPPPPPKPKPKAVSARQPARVRVSAVPVARLAAAAAPRAPGRGLRPDEAALVAEALAAGRVTVCPPRTYALSKAPLVEPWLTAAVALLPRPIAEEQIDALIRSAWRRRTPDSQLAMALGWAPGAVADRRRALGMVHAPGAMTPRQGGRRSAEARS